MSYFVFLCVFAASLINALAIPPPTVRCASGNLNCTIAGTYGVWPDRSTCNVAQVVYPTTEQQIIDAVAYGVRNNMKMKVVTRLSHSMTKLVCPGGTRGLVISTRDYNKNIVINITAMTVTVDSGVELGNFVDTIAESQLVFPQSPYWSGLTMGGLLSTGAHGSSLTGLGSAVHEYVVSIRLVVPASAEEGYAEVVTFTQEQEDLNAVKVSLGVLGVISKITLKVEPMFKRSVTNRILSDSNLEQIFTSFPLDNNQYGDITWYPSIEQAVYRIDVRVPNLTPGDGTNDFIGFQPTATIISQSVRLAERLLEATENSGGICDRAKLQIATLVSVAYGLKNGIIFTGYPIVGAQNKIQTSGTCYNSTNPFFTCGWDPSINGLFFRQTTVSIAMNKAADFILDVKELRRLNPEALCGPDGYSGFLMRYVKNSTAYLGKPEDSLDIDITYYRADDPRSPRLHEDVLEEIEQMAVFKYQGIPHFGKNRNVAFLNVTSKFPNLEKFLDVKRRLDPNGFFSSEWSDLVLGIASSSGLTSDGDYCALEGLCICSEDRHCAPDAGYFCRPGQVYSDARVCRYEAEIASM